MRALVVSDALVASGCIAHEYALGCDRAKGILAEQLIIKKILDLRPFFFFWRLLEMTYSKYCYS